MFLHLRQYSFGANKSCEVSYIDRAGARRSSVLNGLDLQVILLRVLLVVELLEQVNGSGLLIDGELTGLSSGLCRQLIRDGVVLVGVRLQLRDSTSDKFILSKYNS